MPSPTPYRRVLVKISGEALCAPGGGGIDADALAATAGELRAVVQAGTQVALVVGGGNILRGQTLTRAGAVGRVTADWMGMLATVINALALAEALEADGMDARVLSAIPVPGACARFDRREALAHLQAGRVVLLAGGTGNPFFTTDTCAALRAGELDCQVLLKATKVNGVFDSDPAENPRARKFDRLTCAEVLARRLGVMDLAAVSLCLDAAIPVIVFRLATPGALAAAVRGEPVGTVISAS